jgi:hypothetical protein
MSAAMEGICLPCEGLAEVEWALSRARSGGLTLRVAGQSVHSAYEPEREALAAGRAIAAAAREAGAQAVALLGQGLGHVPEALRREWAGELLPFEPLPGVRRDLERAGAPPGAPGVETAAAAFEDALARLAAAGRRVHVAAHPGYTEICRFELRLAARALRRGRGGPAAPALEQAVVSPRGLEALARFPRRRTLADLAGCCEGQTALLVAPGPTLRDALPALAARRGGVLFAAVQALRALGQAGVHVDFAVAPDPLHSTPFLSGFEPQFGWLLAEAGAEPELLDRWPERTALFALRSSQLYDLAFAACGEPPFDEPMNTVSETMLHLARQLGARRLALVGVDLCGPKKGVFRARRASGAEALTNSHYFHAARYLSWRCPALAAEGCEVFRVGDGLPIEGARQVPAERLPALLAGAPPFEPPAAGRASDPRRLTLARELLERALALPPAARPRGAAPDVDARNRWSCFADLGGHERATACRDALRALAAQPQ